MGWTFFDREPGVPVRHFLDRRLEWSDADVESTVLASSVVRFRTYYAAREYRVRATGQSVVVGVVGLLDIKPGVLGVKLMDECVGPVEARAPRLVLDLLSPLEDSDLPSVAWARDWRRRCRENLDRTRLAGAVRVGDVVTLRHQYAGCSEWMVASRAGARVGFVRNGESLAYSPVTLRKWRDNLVCVSRGGEVLA